MARLLHVRRLFWIALLTAACTDKSSVDSRTLSRRAEPANMRTLAANRQRHYPAELRAKGVHGTTLVDVFVSAAGRVEDVAVVPRPAEPGSVVHRATLREPGATRRMEVNDRPEFGAAAQAALREARFQPALADGNPVLARLRMTIEFDPSAH